ncbi:MAG: glutamine-hydrolyzing carbamoyl-phosphate synthase small subunit [Erysipelotrichaceae bacterium]
MSYNKKLVLSNGREFHGYSFGADSEVIAEIVFNTSMVGYQEIVSDCSYNGQIVMMTYPLIGNYGITDEDYEAKVCHLKGMIVKEYNDKPSNFRYTKTLSELLEDFDVVGIYGVDTRAITRIIRDEGTQKVMIANIDTPIEKCLELLNQPTDNSNLVKEVSCTKRWYARTANAKFHVVAIDCGIKLNIIKHLNNRACNVTIVPYNTTAEEIIKLSPDGLFVSNGPGDPQQQTEVIETIKKLQGKLPIFGICLGHQIIALANGANTFKMKFGHRGANHPVKNLLNNKIEITSQNHSYAVDSDSLKCSHLSITHINLLNDSCEGLESVKDKLFSIQYHPESAPGPEDSTYLFDKFISYLKGANHA